MDTRELTVLAEWRSAQNRPTAGHATPPAVATWDAVPPAATAGGRGQVVEVDFGQSDAVVGGDGERR